MFLGSGTGRMRRRENGKMEGEKKMSTELSLKDRIIGAIHGFRGEISRLKSDVSRLKSENSELTSRTERAERQLREIAKAAGVETD